MRALRRLNVLDGAIANLGAGHISEMGSRMVIDQMLLPVLEWFDLIVAPEEAIPAT